MILLGKCSAVKYASLAIMTRAAGKGMGNESTIGEWIRHQLAHRDWTAADLSRRLGVSSGRISEWSSGRYTPSPASCLRLAEVFVADPDQVLALAGHRAVAPPPEDAKSRLITLIQR